MYKFADVNQIAPADVLPAEALQINGQYIENLIAGYRTLTVSGREALSPELNTYETGVRDGAVLKNKRFPPRTITVQYQIVAKTDAEFRAAYNQLGGILNVENAELIFADEPEMFFTGTPSFVSEIEPGRNAVTGEFELLCIDPFKYSVAEYSAMIGEDGENGVMIDYSGTAPSHPILSAEFPAEYDTSADGETETTLTGGSDCGYVAFFNDEGKIIQLGDPEEIDGNPAKPSQTLISSAFKTAGAWGTAARKPWTINSAVSVPGSPTFGGTLAMKAYGSASGANTSGTLLSTKTTSGAPLFAYKVSAKSTNRTASSVKVTVTITASLGKDTNFFGRPYVLNASVYIGGTWRTVTLKKADERWEGRTAHTKNIVVTISGLSASTTAITGIKFKATRGDSGGTAGILSEKACANLKISTYSTATDIPYYLTPSTYGTGAKWHGCSILRKIPADASGVAGADWFKCAFGVYFGVSGGNAGTKEAGAFQIAFYSGSGSTRKRVIDLTLLRDPAKFEYVLANLYILGKKQATQYRTFSLFRPNAYHQITSAKGKVTVRFSEKDPSLMSVYDENIVGETITEMAITFLAYGTKPVVKNNCLTYLKFIKNNCETFIEIPNKFSAGDVVTADCNSGEIALNGVLSPDLGALGNDWEGFQLNPGFNQIGASWSDFAEDPPNCTVKYREVYL